MNTAFRTASNSFFLGALLCLSQISHAESSDISGTWRSIDDKTGYAKSLIKIEKIPMGCIAVKLLKSCPHAGYKPEEFCIDCPAPFTGKPIEGLNVLTGLKANPSEEGLYDGGKILDPLSGHIYSTKIKLNSDGKKLVIRGFIGFSLLGRSQTWYREDKAAE